MEEKAKEHRPVSVIQQEYQSLCTRAGHVQYQIKTLEDDIRMLHETMKNLNFEAAASSRAEAEQKEAEQKEAPKLEEVKSE